MSSMPIWPRLRNLMLAIERCHLAIEAMVASPYMAGLSALADDEADLGSAVVDMGAGTTTIAVFSGGRFVHCRRLRGGGSSRDHGPGARIKRQGRRCRANQDVLWHCNAGMSDERDMIPVPAVGDDSREPPQVVSRAALVPFIRPRIEEILEMIRDRLAASPFASEPQGAVVLTGGASQLRACRRSLRAFSVAKCAIGRPLGIVRSAGRCQGTGFRRCRGASGLSAGCASRTLRTAENAANDDRNRRLFREGRTMAEGKLLMARMQDLRNGRRRNGRCGDVIHARVWKRQP